MFDAVMELNDIPFSLRNYFEQIPYVLGGKLRLRGTRVSIEQVFELLEAGFTPEEIVQSFPSVTWMPSVNFIGWKGVKNVDLLTRACADFDLFILWPADVERLVGQTTRLSP
jgi:uncharacterized protein (DUF433 family)